MKPIPVLIVDDEYLIRSLVRNSVDWEALGCIVVGEAEDGEQALRLVEELKPRLVVVDINIPFINGLDLSLRLKNAHPGLRVIILTGYEDFHFARTAIKVGVVDYLLKPINPEELSRAVGAAREGLRKDDEEASFAHSGPAAAPEDVLRAFLSGEPQGLAAVESVRFGIDLGKPLVLVLFGAEPPLGPAAVKAAAGIPCEAFAYRDGAVALIANEDGRTIRFKDKAYHAACESVRSLAAASGGTVSAGVSLPASGPDRLPAAYEQALSALADAFYVGSGRIHPYAERPPVPEAELPTLPPRASLILLLRSGAFRELESLIRTLFRDLGKIRAPRGYCEMLCLEIALVAADFLKEVGLPANELPDAGADPYRQVRELKTLMDMEAWLAELIERSAAAGDSSGQSRTRLVVKKAKSFIERNFQRKHLTLESIAEQAAVGPSYLSSVFKKELGVSVIEYLTDTRLDAAKALMDADPLTAIIAVAERVGYSDPYYFSKCFRKRFGAAPTVYLRKKDSAAAD